jgi:hypothetical protein
VFWGQGGVAVGIGGAGVELDNKHNYLSVVPEEVSGNRGGSVDAKRGAERVVRV